ncbi:MAG: glycosyltransferase family 2 protein, partial [Lachnospiraceae bacterium]|nr:glycosyltransferase family 2 protein [Lachnospiraceae bacterium]
MSRIDVVVPTYKPDQKFLTLIERLEGQTVKPDRIIVMNTEQKYYARVSYGSHFQDKYKNVEVCHISNREFDLGSTRHMAMRRA